MKVTDRGEADMMEYKNYLAEVEVDESVGLLHGRVVQQTHELRRIAVTGDVGGRE